MTAARPRLLILDCAALGWTQAIQIQISGVRFREARPVFPAVTCTAQATFRTASLPTRHGMVGNGLWFPDLKKVLFWEQSASLVKGARIWEAFRARGKRVGMMFWQQSLGESVDLVLSPRPIHKHNGGMIQDCYSQPPDLYERLCKMLGRPFNLMHYWGPLASRKSSEWIAEAVCAVMADPSFAPDLLLAYLPHLDYDLQRRGPTSPEAARAREVLSRLIKEILAAAEANGYDWLVFGDYSIGAVSRPAMFPNRVLREAGLFWTRRVRGMAYPDFFNSPAFAVVDHEVAHVFCRDEKIREAARSSLASLPDLDQLLEGPTRREFGIDHPNAGDFTLIARRGSWFAYPWWTDPHEAPDYATHIDIHNKPGYDPCELFFGWPPLSISLDTSKVRGSHGRVGPEDSIAWASSFEPDRPIETLVDLALAARDRIQRAI
ncbi:MAG: alkaline phosphatase family protein [Kiritimatiellae bacterium]|nr:alkaline phosphatase family protein [Kiritimatiellia bacterium]MDW8458140.1 alkaline phosphatase family protein [Verrucomicrobiota bacterium]